MNKQTLHAEQNVGPLELRDRLASGERLQLLDVRSVREFDEAHLPGSINVPLEQVEARLDDLHPSDATIIVCQSGRRAGICQNLLKAHRSDLFVLEGGIKAWSGASLPVVKTRANRLPLMRQVQLTAGALTLAGAVLALTVHPLWALVPAAIGTGLTIAGSTGFCGLAVLLGSMPWNRSTVDSSNLLAEVQR